MQDSEIPLEISSGSSPVSLPSYSTQMSVTSVAHESVMVAAVRLSTTVPRTRKRPGKLTVAVVGVDTSQDLSVDGSDARHGHLALSHLVTVAATSVKLAEIHNSEILDSHASHPILLNLGHVTRQYTCPPLDLNVNLQLCPRHR